MGPCLFHRTDINYRSCHANQNSIFPVKNSSDSATCSFTHFVNSVYYEFSNRKLFFGLFPSPLVFFHNLFIITISAQVSTSIVSVSDESLHLEHPHTLIRQRYFYFSALNVKTYTFKAFRVNNTQLGFRRSMNSCHIQFNHKNFPTSTSNRYRPNYTYVEAANFNDFNFFQNMFQLPRIHTLTKLNFVRLHTSYCRPPM